MGTRQSAHPPCTIVPPYMLEAIVRNGSPQERELARRTLETDAALRAGRQARPLALPAPGAEWAAPHKERRVYDAGHTDVLPGTLVRAEGQPATKDTAVNEAYDGSGASFDMFWDLFGRNSIDNLGMIIDSSVHYKQDYANAIWNGKQLAFGDGDGQYFNRLTIAVDVIGHELTHGVIGYQADLNYKDQAGALNESIADVFGSIVKQYSHSQTADEADWLIGVGVFTAKVSGVALRSLKAPGTAYNDPVLGKDPQPALMRNYVRDDEDYGGVHINSGIPNHAFYLAAVALGGYSWEKAGRIWYTTLCDQRLSPYAQFQDFAYLTTDNANTLFGDDVRQAVIDAWQAVGVSVARRNPTDYLYELLLQLPLPA